MLLLKTPDFKESVFFANFVAAALASAAIITQFLDLTGLRSFRTDIQARWSIPIPWLDIPARWEGMFGDPNNAGFIGAFLIVYGLRRTGLFRIYIVVVGSLIVILSQSRTALLAVLIGLAVLLFASSWYRARRFRTSTTMLLIFGSLLFAIAGLLSIDSTFNGRVPIWKASLDLVSENPLFGIGSRGFSVAASAGEIPWNNIDSHNILLDTLLRNGLGAFLLAGAFIVVCLILVTRVIGFDRGTSLAVLLTFFAAAMTYTVTTWIYINVQVLPLIVALLLANSLALMNPGRIRD